MKKCTLIGLTVKPCAALQDICRRGPWVVHEAHEEDDGYPQCTSIMIPLISGGFQSATYCPCCGEQIKFVGVRE